MGAKKAVAHMVPVPVPGSVLFPYYEQKCTVFSSVIFSLIFLKNQDSYKKIGPNQIYFTWNFLLVIAASRICPLQDHT